MYKSKIHILILIALMAGMLCSCSLQLKSNDKPNVIIVLSDDQGWGDVGYNGNKIIQTPILDSLATEGVVFDRFYVSSVCAPTRASILTGKYHLATGTSWVTGRKEVMREGEITIAEVLKANGYATAYFGKWHNGQDYPHNPVGQGFDTFFGFCLGHLNNYFDTELEYNGSKVSTKGYITDVLTDSVLNYITNTEKPFLAFVSYNTPQTPYQVPDKYFNKYINMGLDAKTATIYGMCENIDDNVLRIQNTLKKSQKHDNTIFIFMSDNGPNYVRYNGGLKGRKAQVDEGGVRVPFIIDFPNSKIIPRKITSDFAAHIDLFPTILDLCSIAADTLIFDGKSFAGILIDSTKHLEDRKFYSHQIFDEKCFAGSVRNNKYLLTCYPYDTALYNLNDDPFQMVNIRGFEPAVCYSMINDFNTWLQLITAKGLTPEPIQVGHAAVRFVDLPAHESNHSEHLQFAGGMGWANDWLVNWNNTSDYMQWPLYVSKSGLYSVNLHFVCDKESVGNHFSLTCQNSELNFQIQKESVKKLVVNKDRATREEAVELSWGVQTIGEMNLNKGNCIINLAFTDNIPSTVEIKGLEIIAK